ncbi:hypothetical protein CR513_39961, partial [Mucuna pruriens]
MCDTNESVVGAMLSQRKDKMFHTIYYANLYALLSIIQNIVYTYRSSIKFLLENRIIRHRISRVRGPLGWIEVVKYGRIK